MAKFNPHRLIPNELGVKGNIASDVPVIGKKLRNVGSSDIIIAVIAPAIITLFIAQLLPESISKYSVIITLFIIGIGTTILIAMPEYTSLSGLLSQYKKYKTKTGVEQRRTNDEDQELARKYWETTQSTQSETGVKKVYLDDGAIEREDGTIVGAMKIRGANLDTAPKEVEGAVTESFTNFVNSVLEDYPIQIYLTTRVFDTDDYLEKFRERRDDEDIKDKPLLDFYIQSYLERTPEFLSDYPYREYYIITYVTEFDIRKKEKEQGAFEFSGVPYVGELLTELFGTSKMKAVTEAEIRNKQIEELHERLLTIKKEGIEKMGSNAEADIITDGNEMGGLIKEFWEGRDMSFKMDEEFLRENPVVIGEEDKQKMNEVHKDRR